jgi:hypothetical protein
MSATHSRRDFLFHASAVGVASLFGLPRFAHAEPPPEVGTIRIVRTPALCFAPQFLAEELLRLEGFSEVEYVKTGRQHSHDPRQERGPGHVWRTEPLAPDRCRATYRRIGRHPRRLLGVLR